MDSLYLAFDYVFSVIKNFRVFDIIDILLVAYIMYKSVQIFKETRAEQLVKGILFMGLAYLVANLMSLNTIEYLLEKVLEIGIIALVVLFQPELRRVLEKVGRSKVVDFNVFGHETQEEARAMWLSPINVLCNAIYKLSVTQTGALLIIERKTKLGEQIDTGVYLNAHITEELVGNIFFENTPLHDGATIIRDGKIIAAACFLPKPQDEKHIPSHLGSRHRAALGISEISDSITIIVSEETGVVSVAQDGNITRNFSQTQLQTLLVDLIIPKKEEDDDGKKIRKLGRRNKR